MKLAGCRPAFGVSLSIGSILTGSITAGRASQRTLGTASASMFSAGGSRALGVASEHFLTGRLAQRALGAAAAAPREPRVEIDQMRRLIEISPADPASHTASVVMMHGLGDTANGFADVCHSLATELPHVRFVCPTAPTTPVTLNGGMAMPSWYDIIGLEDRSLESCEGIDASRDTVLELLEKEAALVGHERCVLAGFSQGGAMALYVGLQLPKRLAGIASLSAYLPTPATVVVTTEAQQTPVLLCHGEADGVVRFSMARETEKFLISQGVKRRTFHAYANLGHSVSDEELQDFRDWLDVVIA